MLIFICYQALSSSCKTRTNMTDLCASFHCKWKSFVVLILSIALSHYAWGILSSSNKFTSRHVHAVVGRNVEQTYGAVLSKRKIRCAQNNLKVSPAFFPATLLLNALVYVQHAYSLSSLMVYTLCCRSLTPTIEPFAVNGSFRWMFRWSHPQCIMQALDVGTHSVVLRCLNDGTVS